MNINKLKFKNWIRIASGRGKGLIILAIMIVAAFSFGMLISAQGHEQAAEEETTHAQSGDPHEEDSTIWTCSMHPQIRLSKPGKCPICFMDLIPLEQGAGDQLGPRQLEMSETAKKIAEIQTSPVIRAFAETEVRMNGKIDYDETRVSYITAWVPGRLDKMYADYTGVSVKKGDHMVHMYSPELISAQEELLQAGKAVKKLNNGSSVLKSTAELTLQSARDKLRLYGLSKEQIDEIEQSGKATEVVMLKSPVSGVVVEKAAKEGMYVQTGTRIYTIADLSKLWVLFDAYETDLPWLREGQQVVFTSASFPGQEFKGKITFIDPIIDQKTRIARVRAVVDNKSGTLKPDMYVSGVVKSLLDSGGNVVDGDKTRKLTDQPLLIPASAALLTGKRAVVYVELSSDDGPLFEGREVNLGPRAGDFYVVKSGLSEGEVVVTNGAFKLDSELQIHAKPSMMFAEGGGGAVGHQHGGTMPIEMPSASIKTADVKKASFPADRSAVSALTPVYKSYFELQMALASDDLKKATGAYADLKNRITGVDMELFKGEAHDTWMKLSQNMIRFADEGTKAQDIENSRKAFLGFSRNIIDLHDAFGHADEEDFYLTFCPMANDNKGAYWLQTVDTVYNSFYGAAMLRCGEIKHKLEPRTMKVN